MAQLQFLGCGDAFGSGGRFNTCLHVTGGDADFLIDCGASSMIAMKQAGVAPNAINDILITHFHGDHFGGIPYFLLDAQFFSKRQAPLTIAGPRGIEDWVARVMEATFPGSSKTRQRFDLRFVELAAGETTEFGGFSATPFPVNHGSGDAGPFFAYRIEVDGRILCYSGDTEWTDNLIGAAHQADLFVCEAYFRDKQVMLHLDLATLEAHLDAIAPKRLILTHMTDDMLGQRAELPYDTAEDGLTVEF